MNLIPRDWDDTPSLAGLRRRMRLLDYLPTMAGEEGAFEWWPAVNVNETPETVVVTAEVPGLEPKDIEISLSNDTLTIRGERHEPLVSEGMVGGEHDHAGVRVRLQDMAERQEDPGGGPAICRLVENPHAIESTELGLGPLPVLGGDDNDAPAGRNDRQRTQQRELKQAVRTSEPAELLRYRVARHRPDNRP